MSWARCRILQRIVCGANWQRGLRFQGAILDILYRGSKRAVEAFRYPWRLMVAGNLPQGVAPIARGEVHSAVEGRAVQLGQRRCLAYGPKVHWAGREADDHLLLVPRRSPLAS